MSFAYQSYTANFALNCIEALSCRLCSMAHAPDVWCMLPSLHTAMLSHAASHQNMHQLCVMVSYKPWLILVSNWHEQEHLVTCSGPLQME